MALTDTMIRSTKPSTAPIRLSDSSGLYLLLNPNGSRWWRFDYRHAGKRKTLSLGTYPDTGLKLAREKRDDARKLLASGIDPSAKRQAEKVAVADTFESIAREWFAKFAPGWAKGHADKIISRLERDMFTMRRSPNRRASANCCAPSMATAAASSSSALCASRHSCSRDPANCARRRGPSSTSTR